jgi:PAS domain S-box-containing protein
MSEFKSSFLLKHSPTTDQLALKDRALSIASEGITIADARFPDMPLIYINDGFERLTGYSAENVLGENCRFLQGPGTDAEATREIQLALQEQRECTVEILNYRKDGTPFWNRVSLTPLRDEQGQVTHYIGVQSDITSRVLAEQKLQRANQELAAAFQRTKTDLELAARIQRTLLPPDDFQMRGVNLSWVQQPCEELAGDTLNTIRLGRDRLGLYVADVSGHGVGAALLSVTINRTLSPVPEQSCLFKGTADAPGKLEINTPAQVVGQLNRQFPMDLRTTQYFTLFYGILNTRTGLMRYVTAGHPSPLHQPRGQEPHLLPGEGFPVGLIAGADYKEETVRLAAGDRVIIYTDGLVEAHNLEEEHFGLDRLKKLTLQFANLSLPLAVEKLVQAVEDWCAPGRPLDDVSLLALEYNPGSAGNLRGAVADLSATGGGS